MNTIVDQFSDPGFQVLNQRLQQFSGADEFVKDAELNDDENEKRASQAFAWEERRLFPIDSPSQASLSRLYMTKQAGIPDVVIRRCDDALRVYGVQLPLMEKQAAAPEDSDDDYLLPEIKRYRVKTAEDVKLAIEALSTNLRKLDTDTRARAMVNLAKKAAEFEVPVPRSMLKFAGATMCDSKVLRDWLEARSYTTKDADISLGYRKMAEEVATLPQLLHDRTSLIKVAGAIQELDDAAGLRSLYGKKLPDPLETVFNMDKISEEVMDLAGSQIPMEQLLSIPGEVYRDVLGEDLANEFVNETGDIDPEKLQVILPTVPRDLLKVLTKQMGY